MADGTSGIEIRTRDQVQAGLTPLERAELAARDAETKAALKNPELRETLAKIKAKNTRQ